MSKNIYFGSSQMQSAYVGDAEVQKMYLGETLVFEAGSSPVVTEYEYTYTSRYFMTNYGEWSPDTDITYYAIIPLTIGTRYKVKLTDVTGITRWRNAQASSNVIGSATLDWIGGLETPATTRELRFVATQPYLISYGGEGTGATLQIEVTEDTISNLNGTNWVIKEKISCSLLTLDRRYYINHINTGHPLQDYSSFVFDDSYGYLYTFNEVYSSFATMINTNIYKLIDYGNSSNKSWDINGGSDCTNADVIAWFNINATQFIDS